ncbi:MAG TPA: choice-of-anchor B family protein, partial [Anaerolineales bacterium]|nr:choice-of-anchor B family protein [Anaerolineales bacterium]
MKNQKPKSLWLVLSLFAIGIIILGLSARLPASAQTPDDPSNPPKVDEETLARQEYMALKESQMQNSYRALAPETFTPCVNGFAGPYACLNTDLMAFMPLTAFGAGSSNDVQGWTDPLDGTEYAVLGLNNGTAFIDISDPENPVYLGKLPGHNNSTSTWREIEVMGNYVYVVSEASGHGLQIFDLTQLRNVVNPPVTFTETQHYNQFGNGHTVGGNPATNFMYVMGSNTCSGGLHMVNVANPLNPTNAGCYSADGYSHDAQCIVYNGPDTTYQGHEICFNSNEDTMTIVDVTNKASPLTISINPYAGDGYTHQTWITDDHTYVLLQDELDEQNFGHNERTRIWNVSDLDAPTIIGIHDGPNPSIDHNIYLKDGNAYLAAYTSGLQIYTLGDVANGNLTLIAHFDSYTPSNSANFNGAWAVYPFFDSGTVLITGIGEGMYIVLPNLTPQFSLIAENTDFAFCEVGSESTLLDILDQNGYTGTVSLSALNLPIGSATTFDPPTVIVPGTSTMTLTVTTTPAGEYPFTILADDGVLSDTVEATLTVFDGAPGPITLTTPADTAANVPIPVTFEWQAGTQAASYDLEVAEDAGFSTIVYTATVAGTSHTATYGFDPLTTYYWRVRANNACGDGTFSVPFSFTTEDIPPILLVDDDDNTPDVQATYTNALNALGLSYDVWDTGNSDDEPTTADLAAYDVVIWFSGEEFGGAAGPGSAGETALGAWLDGSGACLLLSSQDYHYDRGMTPFMTDYLGAATITDDDGNYTTVTGQGVFSGLGPYTLTYPFNDYSDPITPNGTAELAFQGNNSNGAALTKETGAYKSSFWVFPWEALSTSEARETALQTFMDWCNLPVDPTPTPTATQTETPTPTMTPTPTETPTPTPTPT